jgi:hypothetical protein
MSNMNTSEISLHESEYRFSESVCESPNNLLAEINNMLTSRQPACRKQPALDLSDQSPDGQQFLQITDDCWHTSYSPKHLPDDPKDQGSKDGIWQKAFDRGIEHLLKAQKDEQTPGKSDKERAQELLTLLKEGKWNDKVKEQVEQIFRSCHSPRDIVNQIGDDIEDDTPFSLGYKPGNGIEDPEIIRIVGKKPSSIELQIRLEKQLDTGEGEYLKGGWKLKTKDGVEVRCKYQVGDSDHQSYEVKDGGNTYKFEWSKDKDRYKLTVVDANGNKSEHMAVHSRRRGLHQTYEFPAVGITLDEGNGKWNVKIGLPRQRELFVADTGADKLFFQVRKPKN